MDVITRLNFMLRHYLNTCTCMESRVRHEAIKATSLHWNLEQGKMASIQL